LDAERLLLQIDSAAEESFIATMIPSSIWIGASDTDIDGTFVWSDASPIVYSNWGPAQPDAYAGPDCVEKRQATDGLWYDQPCGGLKPYVCESPAVSVGADSRRWSQLRAPLGSSGRAREYRLFVPDSYDGTTRLPLMFNLHGTGGTAAGQAQDSGMELFLAVLAAHWRVSSAQRSTADALCRAVSRMTVDRRRVGAWQAEGKVDRRRGNLRSPIPSPAAGSAPSDLPETQRYGLLRSNTSSDPLPLAIAEADLGASFDPLENELQLIEQAPIGTNEAGGIERPDGIRARG
jgi:hypothetical protein